MQSVSSPQAGGHGAGNVEVFVKTLTGQTLTLQVTVADSVYKIKDQVTRKTGIPRSQQRLSYASRPLDDHRTLSDYNVRPGTTLHLALRLRGGMQAPTAPAGEEARGSDAPERCPGCMESLDATALRWPACDHRAQHRLCRECMGTTIARLANWPRWPGQEGAQLDSQAYQMLQDQVTATVLQAQEATTDHHTAVITCPVCRAPWVDAAQIFNVALDLPSWPVPATRDTAADSRRGVLRGSYDPLPGSTEPPQIAPVWCLDTSPDRKSVV